MSYHIDDDDDDDEYNCECSRQNYLDALEKQPSWNLLEVGHQH